MRGFRNFNQEGGGSRSDGWKTVWTAFFGVFFSPKLILQLTEGVQWF